MRTTLRPGLLLGTTFAVIALAVAVPWVIGPLSQDPSLRLPILVAGGVAWALVLATAQRWGRARWAVPAVICGAVVLRVLALLGTPGTSDDVYRYVFEGAVVLEGQSPYGSSPASPQRAGERERWPELFERINHPQVAAAYPPLTEALCALGVLLAGGPAHLDTKNGLRDAVLSLRILFALLDICVLLALASLLRACGRDLALLVAWGWCPLVVLESGGAPHFDCLGILLLLAALGFSLRRRQTLASLFLAGGALVKWLPIAATPFVARQARRPLWAAALVLAGVLMGFVPFALASGAGQGLFSGLSEYAFRWESFNVLFRWIERPLREHFPVDEGWNDYRRLSRAIVLMLFVLGALVLWLKRVDVVRATGCLVALFLLLTPTLQPWYLLWIVPFLALRRSPAYVWLLVSAPLLYWPLARSASEGIWAEPPWLWPAVALPFLLLLVCEAVCLLRSRRRRSLEQL